MYRLGRTTIPGQSFRPFSQRLGDYQRFDFTIPTATTKGSLSIAYGNQPVTGRLGADSAGMAGLGPIALIAAGVVGWYLFFGGRRG